MTLNIHSFPKALEGDIRAFNTNEITFQRSTRERYAELSFTRSLPLYSAGADISAWAKKSRSSETDFREQKRGATGGRAPSRLR